MSFNYLIIVIGKPMYNTKATALHCRIKIKNKCLLRHVNSISLKKLYNEGTVS